MKLELNKIGTNQKQSNVAFLGMGVMGAAMASNMAIAGCKVKVWNRTPTSARVKAAVNAGCELRPTIPSAVNGANIICICVSDIRDVEEILFETDGGAANGAMEGALILDFSTGSPESARRFAQGLHDLNRGLRFVDTPVTGGDTGARESSLTIIAGGDEPDILEAILVFSLIGKQIFHCGPVGTGQAMKLVNQVLCAVHSVALAEAFQFASHNGIDLSSAIEVCGGGAGGSWALQNLGPRVVSGDLQSGFSIRLMRKDIRLIRAAGCTLPGVELADALMRLTEQCGSIPDAATQAMIQAYTDDLHAEPPVVYSNNAIPYSG